MNPHIQRLQESINQIKNAFLAGNDFASTKDTAELFKEMADTIVDISKRLEAKIALFEENILEDLNNIDVNSDSKLHEVKNSIVFEMENVRKKIDEVKVSLERDIDLVRAEIPTETDLDPIDKRINEIEDRMSQKGDYVQLDSRLKAVDDSLIKLEEKIKDLDTKITNKPTSRLGMRKIPIIKKVRLTDQVDGITRSFNLPKDTIDVLGLWGTSFPITFDTADWTLSGNTLTLATAIPTPESGQTLMAIVETLFYG